MRRGFVDALECMDADNPNLWRDNAGHATQTAALRSTVHNNEGDKRAVEEEIKQTPIDRADRSGDLGLNARRAQEMAHGAFVRLFAQSAYAPAALMTAPHLAISD